MMQLRHIAQSVLCCLLCLTVCAVPALAGNEQYTDGYFYWANSKGVAAGNASKVVYPLEGFFPATFSVEDGDPVNDLYRNFKIYGKPFILGDTEDVLWQVSDTYVEVLFPVPAPLTVTVSDPSSTVQAHVSGNLQLLAINPSGGYQFNGSEANASYIECIYDDEYVVTTPSGEYNYCIIPTGTYEVKRYFGYRYFFDHFYEAKTLRANKWLLAFYSLFSGIYSFSDPNYVQGIYDEVIVNTGVIQEINGKLTEIQTSTNQIKNDVSEIKGGLQDSNSSIWGAFKDSVAGLFVPSSAELEGVKNGFDQLAQDKLGGAYQTVELVDNGVQSVVDKFKNPGSNPGVEFPGISVPLGGDVGTVTLAASQTVTIPEQITNVLYPVAGVIIPIVCVIWTIRQCTDMVECFMSGMSYAEFLHRNSDEEDEEV